MLWAPRYSVQQLGRARTPPAGPFSGPVSAAHCWPEQDKDNSIDRTRGCEEVPGSQGRGDPVSVGPWALPTSPPDLLLPPCCLNPHFLGTRARGCEEKARAQGCGSPVGPRRGPGTGVPLVSSADGSLGAEPTAPPRNPGGAHQSIFSSFCFVKKIAIFPWPFSWPLTMASPPTPGPRSRGAGGEEGLGPGQWWAGRLLRLQATPSTGCPGRGTWRRSWRKARWPAPLWRGLQPGRRRFRRR